MSEITNHKMIVYKFDTDTKNSTSIPSKILTTNRNIFINDSNNQNNNSSLFTNEVLIKNIVNKFKFKTFGFIGIIKVLHHIIHFMQK